jgi:hypothetical protein
VAHFIGNVIECGVSVRLVVGRGKKGFALVRCRGYNGAGGYYPNGNAFGPTGVDVAGAFEGGFGVRGVEATGMFVGQAVFAANKNLPKRPCVWVNTHAALVLTALVAEAAARFLAWAKAASRTHIPSSWAF